MFTKDAVAKDDSFTTCKEEGGGHTRGHHRGSSDMNGATQS